ncbi:MAG: nuclease [Terriglobales bacterium]
MKLVKRSARAAAVLCLIALCVQIAGAWGDMGHMMINRTAAEHIPASMPQFLKQAASHIEYLGPEPDRWRNPQEASLKNAQEPDHFIDLERVADIPQLPEGRYEFYRLLYAKKIAAKSHAEDFDPDKVGLQPYATTEVFQRLVVAFREYRRLQAEGKPTADAEQNAIFYAGWLGHYVADGANPMHTTIQYNGWVGDNPNGYTTAKNVHYEFESGFVQRAQQYLAFGDLLKDPVQLQHPFQDYVAYLRASNALVEKTYQLEKAGAFKDTGTPEGREFVRERLAAGAQELLDLWYTAWEQSGVPLPERKPSS